MGQACDAGMGAVVHARGTGTPAGAPLPPGDQPVHFLLGRRGAGRAVPGLAGGEVTALLRSRLGVRNRSDALQHVIVAVALQDFHGDAEDAAERGSGQRWLRGPVAVGAAVDQRAGDEDASVDLPDPFGPRIATFSPCAMDNVTPSGTSPAARPPRPAP